MIIALLCCGVLAVAYMTLASVISADSEQKVPAQLSAIQWLLASILACLVKLAWPGGII